MNKAIAAADEAKSALCVRVCSLGYSTHTRRRTLHAALLLLRHAEVNNVCARESEAELREERSSAEGGREGTRRVGKFGMWQAGSEPCVFRNDAIKEERRECASLQIC